MKHRHSSLLLLAVSLISSAHSQTSPVAGTLPPVVRTYEQWIKRAEDGARISPRSPYVAKQYEEAAAVAPDDAARLSAWLKAAEHYTGAEKHNEAFVAYEKAAAMAGLTDTQNATIRLGMADAAYKRYYSGMQNPEVAQKVREWYQAFLRTPGISEFARDRALRQIAYTWNLQGEAVNAALELEKIAGLRHLGSYSAYADFETALHFLQNVGIKKPAPMVSALIDRLHVHLVPQQRDELSQVMMCKAWGELHFDYGAPNRGYAVWADLADDAKASYYHRAQAIEKIAERRKLEKQPLLGLKSWERTAKWPPALPDEANWKHIRANSLASLHEALGNEDAVRAELATVATLTGLDDGYRAFALYGIGKSHIREMQRLQNPRLPAQAKAPELSARLAQHEQSAVSTFLKIVGMIDAGSEIRYQAAMRHMEIQRSHKRYDEALKPLLQLTDEWSKSSSTLDDIYLLSLANVSSQLYAQQKNFVQAVSVLNAALKLHKKPDAQTSALMLHYYNAVLALNDWEQCRKILVFLRAGALTPAEHDFQSLIVETNAQNWPAAAATLVSIENAKYAYNDSSKASIAQAKALIPADAVVQARMANKQTADSNTAE